MAVPRYQATAVAMNGLLYVIGGYNGSDPVHTAEVYDPTTNRWRTLTGMPTRRWSPGAAAINGKLYAVGGDDGDTAWITEVYTP